MSSSGSRKETIFIDEQVYASTHEASGVFSNATIPYEVAYQQYCEAALHAVSWKSTAVTKECMGG